MKIYCFCLLLLVLFQTKVHCQPFCTTLGEARRSIVSCRIDTTLQLTHKKYANFDFSKFAPVGDVVNASDFVEVGYDRRGDIREIVRHVIMQSPQRFRFMVFDFEKYRIMLLQKYIPSLDTFYFFSSVFILPKFVKEKSNFYMITFDPIDPVHHSFGLPGTWDTSPDRFRNFTSVSVLDQNLFTKIEYVLNKAHVFLRTEYSYYADGSGRIEKKDLGIFLPIDQNSKQKLGDSICLNDIEWAVIEDPIWYETVYPRLDGNTKLLPLCFSSPIEFR